MSRGDAETPGAKVILDLGPFTKWWVLCCYEDPETEASTAYRTFHVGDPITPLWTVPDTSPPVLCPYPSTSG